MKLFRFLAQVSLLLCIAINTNASTSHDQKASNNSQSLSNEEYNTWLKNKFSKQHEKLIPIVAVADMLYACNKVRQIDKKNYTLSDLILKMDKNKLAEKLSLCLAGDKVQSDVALNFGLFGCFEAQLAHLPMPEREQKMILVQNAIISLAKNERQKSFTQCVTEQAIHYLY